MIFRCTKSTIKHAKQVYLFSLMLLLVISSCTNDTGKTKANASPINCYRYADAKDGVTLKLIHVGESITGTLAYEISPKNMRGTIQGHMDGDVLIATFTPFVDSIAPRQIAFKLVHNYFIEGHGEMEMQNGQMIFSNRSDLRFDEAKKLYEFDCK